MPSTKEEAALHQAERDQRKARPVGCLLQHWPENKSTEASGLSGVS